LLFSNFMYSLYILSRVYSFYCRTIGLICARRGIKKFVWQY
jgi:hypothetical protein